MINKYGSQCYTKQSNGKLGFDKVELPFYGEVSLANGTMFKVGMFKALTTRGRLFVGVENMGSYTFEGFTHPSYVAEKLRLSGSDVNAMADFINGQFGEHHQLHEPDKDYI